MADPWLKFYPTDWRSDPRLRFCSLAARGLWIEMLGIMHEADPIGHLLIGTRAPTDAQLASLVGAPTDQLPELLGELESAGVFSRSGKGVIYSRRMTRDAKKAANARKNGKRGGNPSLRKDIENPAQDNQDLKPQDNGGDKAQKPEARSQKEDPPPPPSLSTSARALDPNPAGGGPSLPPDARERLLRAAGADPVSGLIGPNGKQLGRRDDMGRVERWLEQVTLDEAVAVVAEVTPGLRSPPRSFAVFEDAIDRLVEAKAGRLRDTGPRTAAEDEAAKYARWDRVGRQAIDPMSTLPPAPLPPAAKAGSGGKR